jgi:predicted RNA-binding protein with PIN domain
MSLQYIIDGYNLIRHRSFRPSKKIKEPRFALLSFIRGERLCGSLKNKITIVFDGYCDVEGLNEFDPGINVVFSCDESADERIKKILAGARNPKELVVISDDREIASFTKDFMAAHMGIEQFINSKRNKYRVCGPDLGDLKLSNTQMYEINKELRKKWLGI